MAFFTLDGVANIACLIGSSIVTNKDYPLVDSHFHVWAKHMPRVGNAWHSDISEATIEQAIKVLDDHGVVFGVISAASLYGTYFDYMREALKAHKRLRATAIITPQTDIYQIERMKADGFVGIRLVRHHHDDVPDLETDDYRHMLKRVADVDWHVQIIEREHRMPALIATLNKCGIKKIVVDHLARMDNPQSINSECFKAVAAAVDRGNTWVKLSGGYRCNPTPAAAEPFAQALVRLTGGDRLLWGSDWPFVGFEDKVKYQDTIDCLRQWVPDEHIRQKIWGQNPLKLYFT